MPIAADENFKLSDALIITCSYRKDFDRCRLLCRSVDRFVDPAVRHILFVPACDVSLFSPLATDRREIRAQEGLFPGWRHFKSLDTRLAKFAPFLRRDFFIDQRFRILRGWIAQQIVKIKASQTADAAVLLHLDSDIAMIRPLSADSLVPGGKVRFYAVPGAADLPSHRKWHDTAARLLGTGTVGYSGSDYIDHGTVWSRDIVERMCRRIESVTGDAWEDALSKCLHFSEYILYGMFLDFVDDGPTPIHRTDAPFCLSQWGGSLADAASRTAFLDRLQPDQVGLGAQSTVPLSAEDRTALWEAAIARAEAQDRGFETAP